MRIDHHGDEPTPFESNVTPCLLISVLEIRGGLVARVVDRALLVLSVSVYVSSCLFGLKTISLKAQSAGAFTSHAAIFCCTWESVSFVAGELAVGTASGGPARRGRR